ncbi:hypothetical protein PG984_006541 [Apiospora sp. TS-2023a]
MGARMSSNNEEEEQKERSQAIDRFLDEAPDGKKDEPELIPAGIVGSSPGHSLARTGTSRQHVAPLSLEPTRSLPVPPFPDRRDVGRHITIRPGKQQQDRPTHGRDLQPGRALQQDRPTHGHALQLGRAL